jgi:hypothetical protein
VDAGRPPGRVFARHGVEGSPTSCPVNGLPTRLLRERKRQWRRKPFRCHRTTVSGLTIRRELDHFGGAEPRTVGRYGTSAAALSGVSKLLTVVSRRRFQVPSHDESE